MECGRPARILKSLFFFLRFSALFFFYRYYGVWEAAVPDLPGFSLFSVYFSGSFPSKLSGYFTQMQFDPG